MLDLVVLVVVAPVTAVPAEPRPAVTAAAASVTLAVVCAPLAVAALAVTALAVTALAVSSLAVTLAALSLSAGAAVVLVIVDLLPAVSAAVRHSTRTNLSVTTAIALQPASQPTRACDSMLSRALPSQLYPRG